MQHELTAPAQKQDATSQPLKVKDIAAAMRVDSSTVYRLIDAGQLAAYRIGSGRGSIRVSRAAFAEYLEARGIPAAELAVEL